VNDPPVNTVPSAQSTPQNTALVFSNTAGNTISIADPGVLTVAQTFTITVSHP